VAPFSNRGQLGHGDASDLSKSARGFEAAIRRLLPM